MAIANLLVVDDEPTLVELFVRRLTRQSYKVFTALSGSEALKILEVEEIDVLITDFHMPGMDGCEVIKRASSLYPMLQSIVVTGFSDIKTAINAMGAGAFNYLQKPVDFTELSIVIEKGLEKRKLLQDVKNKQKQLEIYRDQLEGLVENRTVALREANLQLQKEIEERRALEISLREAKAQAENANKAKSEFLANMSHEIRTPMTSAIGLLNLVLDTDLLPKQKAYLEMVRISTVVMHNLLSDILDLSKIEAGRLHLEHMSFSPRTVILSVIDLQLYQAREKNIQLSSAIPEDVPSAVVGDPNRLRQIILNLVSNAIKFTQYGEVVLSCNRAEENHDEQMIMLHFSVRDSGIGIEKEKVGVIFESFTQADSSTTRKFGGVGLGLNICSKLVSMMGGRIWVESKLGQGSIFHFTCRFDTAVARADKTDEATRRKESTLIGSYGENSGTVLVVEDDKTNQWVIREILQHEGYIVVNAADGSTALKECANRYFDLMFLDLRLPDMDGYEVVRQVREREALTGIGEEPHRLPIIALTGLAGEREKQRCLQAGMDDFIAKPFAVDQLISKARQAIGDRISKTRSKVRGKRRGVPNISALVGEIFNESEALRKASGQRAVMLERVSRFLQETPQTIEMLSKAVMAGGNDLLIEQEIHGLKEKAMEIGLTSLADELFSLLMQIRKKQDVQGQIDNLMLEFERFRQEPMVRQLLQ